MKINQRVRYGISCLFELSKHNHEYVDAEKIAHAQSIPSAYAQKVMQTLSHAGLVWSLKGTGYRLARPLSEITAYQVIEALTQDTSTNDSIISVGSMLEDRINKALNFSLDQLAIR
jgi:Rrf2 family protein